jgi:hypothetical protein
MKKILYLFILGLPALFGSCSEEIKPEPNTYTTLLTGEEKKTWHLTTFTVLDKFNQKNSFRLNISNSCEDSVDYYDNYYTFYRNSARTLEITEGPEKCPNYPHDDYYFESSWTVVNANSTLTFPFLPLSGEFSFPFILKDLTEKKLVIQYYDEKFIYQFVLNPVND